MKLNSVVMIGVGCGLIMNSSAGYIKSAGLVFVVLACMFELVDAIKGSKK